LNAGRSWLAACLLCSSCAAFAPVPPVAPAVRGLPKDDPGAALSAVWVGHATVLLRLGHRYVMTDPNLGGSLLIVPRITKASLQPWEVPPLDAVVVSHMHFDHFDKGTLRKLGTRPEVFFPEEGATYAEDLIQRCKPMATWEAVHLPGLTITAVPARHSGGRYGLDALWNHSYTGYVIEGAGRRVFFAGDTGYDPTIFKEIGRRFPNIDLAFIPIAPSRGDDGRKDRWGHVGPREALDIFREVGARYMVPIHHEAYWSDGGHAGEPRRKLLAEAEKRGLADRVFALRTGERFVYPEDGARSPLVISEPLHRATAPQTSARSTQPSVGSRLRP
jgi:L-ascorbate metabolism protein UlaG (beta-lactamase superfamily)